MTKADTLLLRAAIELARTAREHGNHPFGAVLADAEGNLLLQAENTVITGGDFAEHAELNLARAAARQYPPGRLARCTLYASTEPCPMCAGAIFWANIGRVVYALSEEGLYALTGDTPHKLLLSCRQVFAGGARAVEVVGPALEEEALGVHEGFWTKAEGAF
jgi:tRNA(Arg) A34 adenosine deaminase TadA